ncbi:hypothetical protein QCB45_08080 [Thiomicrorhabdus sp. ZW0627]|uniref:hypothetical protein n=1 Tax=Thiomicrorhabdus sp. ZW0627 TaxID=3039774 RepID=UPI00243737E6|nr:hypothetical protein [Thiomicrorhabdus sp. ZW0627]MDG6774289.1 hypothetical protein [Thiomicrorhabdus sp. ZW0627]
MRYITLAPELAEPFKTALQNHGWQLKGQDAGQAHLVGWGYVMHWSKQEERIHLHYKEVQGKAEAQLEMTPSAFNEIQAIVDQLHE